MAHHTLVARINSGNGKFPFVNVRFSRNHTPIPIEGATYYLRPTSRAKRTPIKIGKDVSLAYTTMLRLERGIPTEPTLGQGAASQSEPLPSTSVGCSRMSRANISSAANRKCQGPTPATESR